MFENRNLIQPKKNPFLLFEEWFEEAKLKEQNDPKFRFKPGIPGILQDHQADRGGGPGPAAARSTAPPRQSSRS